MKRTFALLALTSLFSINAFAEITTFNSWRAKKDAKHADVVEAVKTLNAATKGADGLISKKTYYNAESNSWTDIIVWRDQAAADKVSKEQGAKPEFEKLGEIIDLDSIRTVEQKLIE